MPSVRTSLGGSTPAIQRGSLLGWFSMVTSKPGASIVYKQ
jgi:hypothetical protein